MSNINHVSFQELLRTLSPQGRSALLPALHAAQTQFGYISELAAAEIGRALDVPLADIYGVIDFYAMFYDEPAGRTIIRVCADPACALVGGRRGVGGRLPAPGSLTR
jgi:NADH-quinone oxidoreductase subunit F